MPVLVHLADEKESAGIKKNGIKIGKFSKGIFCMPVLQNFYVSHQWLRELKRGGAKTYVGVYFKMDSNTKVYAGRFNKEHRHITLGEAIKEIMSLPDPLGYELIIDRKITAKEIQKIKSLPQKTGWRYYPGSNNKKPTCACRMCVPIGSIKSKRLREKIDPPEKKISNAALLEKLKVEKSEKEIEYLLFEINNRRFRTDPAEFLFLLDKKSDQINSAFAMALSAFRHKNSRKILLDLLKSKHDDTKEYAAYSLLKLYGNEMIDDLSKFKDTLIDLAIEDWKKME